MNKKELITFDRVIENIKPAWRQLRGHPKKDTEGVDGESIASFRECESENIELLIKRLRDRSFCFSKLKPVSIPKGSKKRLISIPCVEDRIVSRSILNVLSDICDKYQTDSNYCPIVKNYSDELSGVPKAGASIQSFIDSGYIYAFETDIINFFPNVNKEKMIDMLKKEVGDGELLNLLDQIINFQIDDSYGIEDIIDTGLSQGSALSPLLANIYLNSFDLMVESLGDVRMIRYVDDLVILCKSKERALQMEEIVSKFLKDNLCLDIHPLGALNGSGKIKTNIVKLDGRSGSLVFLGLKFDGRRITIPSESLDKKRKEVIETLDSKSNLLDKIADIRSSLGGFIRHYQQPHYNTKENIDGLVDSIQCLIESSFVSSYKDIFHSHPFSRSVNDDQKKKYWKLLGVDMHKLKEWPKVKK